MKFFPNLINKRLVNLQRSGIKGKYFFYLRTYRLLKNNLNKHQGKHGDFAVPYDQWCFWKTLGPNGYYLDEMQPFCNQINDYLDSFDFLDLGADVGVVSNLLSNHCSNLKTIYAFEPNPKSFQTLKINAKLSDLDFYPAQLAISNFNGIASLKFDDQVNSDHEGHLDLMSPGTTQVVTLDKFFEDKSLSSHLAIKIDVEGQELQAIEGASNIIKRCEKALVLLEIHPETLDRDGLTPEDIFTTLESITKVKWSVPLLNKEIDRTQPFFSQFPIQQYDVIGKI